MNNNLTPYQQCAERHMDTARQLFDKNAGDELVSLHLRAAACAVEHDFPGYMRATQGITKFNGNWTIDYVDRPSSVLYGLEQARKERRIQI